MFREEQASGASRMQYEHVRALRRLILIHGEGGNININAEHASAEVLLGVENPTERIFGKRQVPRVDLMKSEMVI